MDMEQCTNCAKEVETIDLFPGGLCLGCWAKSPEGRRMPTAQEVVELWGGKWSDGR